MAGTRESKRGGPEYVTDWRVVYAVVGVVTLMLLAGLLWTLFAPAGATPIAHANAAAADTSPVVSARAPAEHTEAVELVVPWDLSQAKRPQLNTTPWSPPRKVETIAEPDSEDPTPVSRDEADHEALALADFEEPTRPGALFAELERAVTLDFNPTKGSPAAGTRARRTASHTTVTPLTQEQHFAQLANQSDLSGLRIRGEDECHKSPKEVLELQRLSRGIASIGRVGASPRGRSFSHSQELGLEEKLGDFIDLANLDSTSVAPLVQILQVQSVRIRAKLVFALSRIEGAEASLALADRALFDLSPEIRELAIKSLKRRDRSEYRFQLLSGFRYPWPAAALHAAEALVGLDDTDALPSLEELLDEPDPSQPFTAEGGSWQKNELVRVNHLRNCLLCHPRSVVPTDPIRAAVPTPGRPLPRTYNQSSADAVRADVTYLRQDFSVVQPVTDPGHWPGMQRFDFLVRTRPLTKEETQEHTKSIAADANGPTNYPQRESVLFAIKGLSKSGT